jgi:methyl-accepting chemotaxis protein
VVVASEVRTVEAGSGLVAKSGSALEEIVTTVRRVTNTVQEIAVATGRHRAPSEWATSDFGHFVPFVISKWL